MANRFLEYYNDELAALRRRATRFADAFPKIAGRLRLARDTSDDPHVERLIQSFAYSAARVRQKIDDSLPELTDGLLETLYPHYLAPVPAMSLVTFAPAKGLESVHDIPRGTQIVSEDIDGDKCRFVTTRTVPLAPVRLEHVRMMDRPIEAPPAPRPNAASCLRITVTPTDRARLHEIGLTRLRLYLSGPTRQANALARLLHQHVMGVAVANHSADKEARHLPANAVIAAGFSSTDALLPFPENGFQGYQILTEFFSLPDQFLFFDIEIGALTQSDRADVYIYFNAPPQGLEKQIDGASLTLHASPIVNLFDMRAEPITLDGTRSHYRLRADARRLRTRRIHSIQNVTLTHASGATEPCQPFFHRLTDMQSDGAYWQLRRHSDGIEDTSVAFVDGRQTPATHANTTASIQVLATNGNLPNRLPYGGGQPRLTLATSRDQVQATTCLRPMTVAREASDTHDRAWQLMSHLSLNHLSLTREGAPALRNILRLYDTGASRETAQMIDAIEDVRTMPGIAQLGGVMVSGIDVTVLFDSQRIDDGQAVVFGAVLDRFLGCYTTLNTFTRLTLRMKDRTDILASFPARSGEEALI
ncbi:MAG: type VI secretion system baseplate subunit TssF [Pseudorhodobacter sp.]